MVKISGVVGETTWSYVHLFSPDEEEKRRARGELAVVLSVKGMTGVAAVAMGREVLARVNEIYYGELKETVFAAFGRCLKKAQEEFSGKGDEEGVSVEIVAGAIWEQGDGEIGKRTALYLGGVGGGEAWVRRKTGVGRVLEVSRTEEAKVVSGWLEDGEMVIMGTPEFFGLAQGVLRAALETQDEKEAAEMLTPLIEGKEGAAGVVVRIKTDQLPGRMEVQESDDTSGRFGATDKQRTGRWERVKEKWIGLMTRRRREAVFVGGERRVNAKARITKLVGIVLLVMLITSLLLGGKERKRRESEAKYGGRVNEAVSKFKEGQDLAELNPVRARQLLTEAKNISLEVGSAGYRDKRLDEINDKIGDVLGAVTGENRVIPETFLDLGLVREGMKANGMAFSLDKLALLDLTEGRLVEITASGKAAQVLAGGEMLSGSKWVAEYASRGFVLGDKGIIEAKSKEKGTDREQAKVVIEKDSEWGEIGGMVAYGGNLYLLDRTNSAVWRYPGIEGGFGAKQRWLGKGVEMDFSKATDMAIDGNIWVGTATGKVAKLVMGSPELFGISGIENPVESVDRLDTNDDADNLYILEKGKKRVVVVSKDKGEYKQQFIWEGMDGVSDLAVDEKNKKLYLLAGSKILMVGLK